ncbi:MAG: YicC family protein [Planctomycetes bacterium]|jgi:uncharacterized protein (TIGR00255 family)|nr:YicC family protein [Planctomycetota bacterium]
MISSMTGFGQACTESGGVVYTVEVRTVNNRYFKAQLRLPDIAAFMEGEIEKLHREKIHRGMVSYTLRMKNISGQALFDIDEVTLKTYVNRLGALVDEDRGVCRIDLASLLNLPGIVQPVIPDEQAVNQMRRTILDLTRQALEELIRSRLQEGGQLAEDMLSNCDAIESSLEAIRTQAPLVVREYQEKLRKRIDELLASAQLKIDEDQLAREMAIYADRCDIAEEISRLEGHVGQFRQSCSIGGAVGRRLDFIAQEMLREANTIGSKSSNVEIIRHVIDIKCAVDRIKEQVQNVE